MQLVKVGSRIINLDNATLIELGATDTGGKPCVKVTYANPAHFDRFYHEEADALVSYLTQGWVGIDAMGEAKRSKEPRVLEAIPLREEDIPF